MTKYIIALILTAFSMSSAQNDITKISQDILDEGILMYNLERASWLSTDYLLEQHDVSIIPNNKGYITYTKDGAIFSTYWQEVDSQLVIYQTYVFSMIPDSGLKDFNNYERKPTDYEQYLFDIRNVVYSELINDTIYKLPENTSLNLVFMPGVREGINVYIITGPQTPDVIPLGNDYVLNFDSDGNMISKKKLHNNYIPIDYSKIPLSQYESSVHTHSEPTSMYITPTDICNLMLYTPDVDYTHLVISEKYVSFFTPLKRKLLIVTRKAYDDIINK